MSLSATSHTLSDKWMLKTFDIINERRRIKKQGKKTLKPIISARKTNNRRAEALAKELGQRKNEYSEQKMRLSMREKEVALLAKQIQLSSTPSGDISKGIERIKMALCKERNLTFGPLPDLHKRLDSITNKLKKISFPKKDDKVEQLEAQLRDLSATLEDKGHKKNKMEAAISVYSKLVAQLALSDNLQSKFNNLVSEREKQENLKQNELQLRKTVADLRESNKAILYEKEQEFRSKYESIKTQRDAYLMKERELQAQIDSSILKVKATKEEAQDCIDKLNDELDGQQIEMESLRDELLNLERFQHFDKQTMTDPQSQNIKQSTGFIEKIDHNSSPTLSRLDALALKAQQYLN